MTTLPAPAVNFTAQHFDGSEPIMAAPTLGFEVVWSGDMERPYLARWIGTEAPIGCPSWSLTLAILAGLSAKEVLEDIS